MSRNTITAIAEAHGHGDNGHRQIIIPVAEIHQEGGEDAEDGICDGRDGGDDRACALSEASVEGGEAVMDVAAAVERTVADMRVHCHQADYHSQDECGL